MGISFFGTEVHQTSLITIKPSKEVQIAILVGVLVIAAAVFLYRAISYLFKPAETKRDVTVEVRSDYEDPYYL